MIVPPCAGSELTIPDAHIYPRECSSSTGVQHALTRTRNDILAPDPSSFDVVPQNVHRRTTCTVRA